MNPVNRNYKATFIIDTRNREETVEELTEGMKKEITALGGEVSETDDLGLQTFARATEKDFTEGNYTQIFFTGPADLPRKLQDNLRLNTVCNRVVVQLA
ncbi:MAG: 30S ribosomal protein S6 [Opitutaceae bacterium]|nr:30S ribosomal protein S6 [Opitutaceae bacterium]